MGKVQGAYFSHDGNARNDSKIVRLRMKHGARGYGIYFMILERLREEDDYMGECDYDMLAFDFREDAKLIRAVVEDFGLFVVEDGHFHSESFNRRMQAKDDVVSKRSEAGKKGMSRRWSDTEKDNKAITELSGKDNKAITELSEKDNKAITELSGKDNKAITELSGKDNKVITELSESDNKESKVKKSKEKNIYSTNTTTPCACARTRDDPTTDAERLERQVGESLLPESEWREAVWMKHGIQDEAEYRRLLDGFMQECLCNGKTSHADDGDLRQHFNSWLRIERKNGGGTGTNRRKGRARMATPPAIAFPTEEEMAEEEARKAEEERQRVLGIYEGARKGNRRFLAIVGEWAKNGTLREYGLEALT